MLERLEKWTNYTAFGSIMPGRSFTSSSYRYGFNGQEKDDEIVGAGNINTAMFWEYDTRLGRRWNIDPIVKPNEAPYMCFSNNPVMHSDVLGNDIDYGSRKQKRDIKYLRKHDAEYNAWWNQNAAKYENDKDHNLVINVVAGRNDLKHSELQSERYTDGKATTENAYLYYDGTLNHRDYGVIPSKETRLIVQGASSNGTTYTEFSFKLTATLPTFKKWEATVDESSVDKDRPSGRFNNIHSRTTIYSGKISATASTSYDDLGARHHPGSSEAYIIFKEIGRPVYYNQTLTRKGWGTSTEIKLPDHRSIINDK